MIVLWIALGIVGIVVLAMGIYMIYPIKYPKLTESDNAYAKWPWWHLYYSNKYLRGAIKRAEPNSGLERHFAQQKFDLSREPLAEATTFTISAVGDLMCCDGLSNGGARHLWDDIGERLFGSDLTIGNFEFAVNPDWLIDKLYRFSVKPSQAAPLLGDERYGRFDVLSLANNHINDSLSAGIKSTCDYLDRERIVHVGAARTPDEQRRVRLVERGGVKVGLLGYTFTTNGIPLERGFEHGTNVVRFNALNDGDYDPSFIHTQIELARQEGAEFIVANLHWGVDLELYPPKRLVTRAHGLMEAGIDVIIGHHTHVPGQVERYRTADGRDTIICYSLGNCTAHHLIRPIQMLGQMVQLTVESGLTSEGEKMVRVCKVALVPIYHSRQKNGSRQVAHRLLNLKKSHELIDKPARPAHLDRRTCDTIKELHKTYDRYFNYRGVEYPRD